MENQNPTSLGELLGILMKRDRMSIDFMATELGISKPSVHDLLKGRNKGTHPKTIAKLADLFNLDPNYLYGLTNQIPPDLRVFIRDRPAIWEGIRQMMIREEESFAEAQRQHLAHAMMEAATFAIAPYNRKPE